MNGFWRKRRYRLFERSGLEGTNVVRFAEDLKNEFYPIGHPQLLEDFIDVIFDRVLADGKHLSDFAICKSLDQAMDDLFFPRGQGHQPLRIELGRNIRRQGCKNKT